MRSARALHPKRNGGRLAASKEPRGNGGRTSASAGMRLAARSATIGPSDVRVGRRLLAPDLHLGSKPECGCGLLCGRRPHEPSDPLRQLRDHLPSVGRFGRRVSGASGTPRCGRPTSGRTRGACGAARGAERSAGGPRRRVPRQRTPTLLRDRLVGDTQTSTDAAKSTGVKVGLGFSAVVSRLVSTSLLGRLQVEPCWRDPLESRKSSTIVIRARSSRARDR
jgi:hypothetical protein